MEEFMQLGNFLKMAMLIIAGGTAIIIALPKKKEKKEDEKRANYTTNIYILDGEDIENKIKKISML